MSRSKLVKKEIPKELQVFRNGDIYTSTIGIVTGYIILPDQYIFIVEYNGEAYAVPEKDVHEQQ